MIILAVVTMMKNDDITDVENNNDGDIAVVINTDGCQMVMIILLRAKTMIMMTQLQLKDLMGRLINVGQKMTERRQNWKRKKIKAC